MTRMSERAAARRLMATATLSPTVAMKKTPTRPDLVAVERKVWLFWVRRRWIRTSLYIRYMRRTFYNGRWKRALI